jgi:hypothetical protein
MATHSMHEPHKEYKFPLLIAYSENNKKVTFSLFSSKSVSKSANQPKNLTPSK